MSVKDEPDELNIAVLVLKWNRLFSDFFNILVVNSSPVFSYHIWRALLIVSVKTNFLMSLKSTGNEMLPRDAFPLIATDGSGWLIYGKDSHNFSQGDTWHC